MQISCLFHVNYVVVSAYEDKGDFHKQNRILWLYIYKAYLEIVGFFFLFPILFTCNEKINLNDVMLPTGIEAFGSRVKLNITGNFQKCWVKKGDT